VPRLSLAIRWPQRDHLRRAPPAAAGLDAFSARSINAHATAIKSFSRRLWRGGRATDCALNAVTKRDESVDRRRVRRVLTEAGMQPLIASTRASPPWRELAGPDRVMFYAVAASTGLRRGELASLTPKSFRLDRRPLTIIFEAAYTKNHRTAEQPIPGSLAAILGPWLASKVPGRPVFHPLSQKTGLMLATGLKRCGIEPVAGQGRMVDTHSLRHGYITPLARTGVPVKTLQTLARHSDPKLTLHVYSHLTLHDTAGALDALPGLSPTAPKSEPRAATGTDGQPISEPFAHHLPTGGDASGLGLADADVRGEAPPIMAMNRNPLEMTNFGAQGRELPGSVARVGDEIRTRDIQVRNRSLNPCRYSRKPLLPHHLTAIRFDSQERANRSEKQRKKRSILGLR
jgi:integrase